MFKRIAGSLLLFTLLWIQSSHYPSAQARGSRPSLLQSPTQQNAGAQRTQEATTLEAGKPVERELSGGQKHIYQLSLDEGQYANVAVEQRGIDVVVRVFDAGDKLIAEFDSEIRLQGTEEVELVASATNTFRLEVEAKLKSAPASRYEVRVAELRPATEPERSLQEARVLLAESLGLSRGGKYKEALSLAERALEIREKALGSEHRAVAVLLNRTGNLNFSLGDIARAEALFQRALNIYEKQLGPDDLNVADLLNNLSVLYRNRGAFVEAETMLQRVLFIREKALGPDHTLVAAALNNLGALYRRRGDHVKAERMYERSLEIRERTLGMTHPDLAPVLENLAALNYFKGDYATALTLDLRVLKIHEKNSGSEHPDVAEALSNLALVYADGGEPEKAEPLYQRALAIREKSFGREHLNSAPTLHSLARLYRQQGDYAKAKPLFQSALHIAEKNIGNDPARVSNYLDSLGGLYTLEGDYAQAEMHLKRALEIREKILGEDHYDVGRTCDGLARLYALKGDVAQAVIFQARANKINEKNIALNLAIGSEHQKLSYMSLMSEGLNQTIALHANMARENAVAREQAITAILQRKGRVLDAMAAGLSALRGRFEPQDRILFDRLNDTNARLADLALGGPRRATLAEHRNQLAAIQEQKDKLETEISSRSTGFYERSQPVTLAATQAVIPDAAALIEFAVYRPLDVKAKGSKTADVEPRYVVYVIRRRGEVQWAELGAVKEIDYVVKGLRRVFGNPKSRDVRESARAAYEKLMRPVRALAGDAKHLLISPDGELNLIPFEALIDDEGRYLIESYAFTYLTSGRDLLRMRAAPESRSKSLVVANPSFGERTAEQTARVYTTSKVTARGRTRSVTTARDLSEVFFAPLGGTAQEAGAVKNLLQSTLLTKASATESALKEVAAPRVLHVATHGFFLQDDETPNGAGAQVAARSVKANARIENPLLRSGLALAGANRRGGGGGGDDGILTALEASGLNLWGTKLVVLSACDTGVGEVRNGEGVYGLRRAFVLAGAESLVMSLWHVSDYPTGRLMTSYYENLVNLNMGRGAALRKAQLDMLNRDPQPHPFYWANFIQSGEWANLDGKR